jgi:hypothetical protein
MEGEDVTKGFQGSGKHGRKKGELNLYDKFGTTCGGAEPLLSPLPMNRFILHAT